MIQIYDLNAIQDQEIFLRRDEVRDVSAPVAGIIRTVREQGDRALYEYARRFDGAELSALSVTEGELEAALARVEPEFLAVLREAADNIRAYHAKQKRESFVMTQRDGVILGQRILPLARVGIYVPGGTASYPSTVLMNAIPAQIAGVEDIVMVTPPGRDGAVSPAILAAAQVAGVTRIFKCGGAQAIAALAYGTESVPQVDKIVLEVQLSRLEREDIARESIERNGKIIVARSLEEGIQVANRIAPEHLELCVDQPFDYLSQIRNAGSIFLGRYDPEPMGDYFAGPNHTLPTMGTARFYSPLSVDDFIKKSQFSYYTRAALERDYRKVGLFARQEGLTAHARAVEIRFEGKEGAQ